MCGLWVVWMCSGGEECVTFSLVRVDVWVGGGTRWCGGWMIPRQKGETSGSVSHHIQHQNIRE